MIFFNFVGVAFSRGLSGLLRFFISGTLCSAEDQIMKIESHFIFAGGWEMCDDLLCVEHSAASDKQSSLS